MPIGQKNPSTVVWSAEDSALIQLLLLCNNDKSRLMHWDTRFGTKQLVLLKLHISILVCFFLFFVCQVDVSRYFLYPYACIYIGFAIRTKMLRNLSSRFPSPPAVEQHYMCNQHHQDITPELPLPSISSPTFAEASSHTVGNFCTSPSTPSNAILICQQALTQFNTDA